MQKHNGYLNPNYDLNVDIRQILEEIKSFVIEIYTKDV